MRTLPHDPVLAAPALPVSADIGTHETVVEIFRSLPRGRVLDAPAGAGALSQKLGELGFEVIAADWHVPPSLTTACAHAIACDLNAPLPFAAATFDSVATVEGIEHLENPFALIREFGRVLRPGGHLVLTTPNVLVLSSRIRFLVTGFFNKFPRPLDERRHDPSFHINPLPYPELRFILRRCGFVIQDVTTNRVKRKERLLAGLLGPAIRLMTRIVLSSRETVLPDEAKQDVRRHLTSRAILGGQALIVVARKEEAG